MAGQVICVIPHQVRDHAAFDVVHEDHIVVEMQGKSSTFDFSAVLSPAHNLLLHVVGPLLDRIRLGGNGALLMTSPGSSGEASTVWMELLANFLPLLFRALPSCSIAHVSVVEASRDGRSLTDLYQMVRVQHIHDIETEEILRTAAGAAWGTVMELLSQRGSWSNLGENAVFALVRMEGYGTAVVGDLGCTSELLHQMHLLLRSGHAFDGVAAGGGSSNGRHQSTPVAHTVAPRVLLTKLLAPVLASKDTTVHVVVIPDPEVSEVQTLRVLHFGAGLLREATLSYAAHSSTPTSTAVVGSASSSTAEQCSVPETTTRRSLAAATASAAESEGAAHKRSRPQAAAEGASSLARNAAAAAAPTQSSADTRHSSIGGGGSGTFAWRDEIVNSFSNTNASAADRNEQLTGNPLQGSNATLGGNGRYPAAHSPSRRQTFLASGNHPSDSHDTCGGSSLVVLTPSRREQQLSDKVLESEKTVARQKQRLLALQNELKRLQEAHSAAVRECEDLRHRTEGAELSASKARQEQQEAAELVAKLLKRVNESERSREKKDDDAFSEWKRKHEELLMTNATLQGQLKEADHRIRVLQNKETSRVRENTLSNITHSPSRSRVHTRQNILSPSHPGRNMARRRHRAGGSGSLSDEGGPLPPPHLSAEDLQVHDGLLQSIKQLRSRCAALESENSELRVRHQQEEAFRSAVALVDRIHGATAGGSAGAESSPSAIGTTSTSAPVGHGVSASVASSVVAAGGRGGGANSRIAENEVGLLQQQVQFLTREVARVQTEKDSLQSILSSHPRSVDVTETVKAVGQALVNGCASLLVQLRLLDGQLAANAAAATPRDPSARRVGGRTSAAAVPPPLSPSERSASGGLSLAVAQHIQALSSLQTAVEEIVTRRSSYANGGVPSTATAADCDALSHFLTFEVERLTHLRAFLPTFGQLCVAVEHLKMRTVAPASTMSPAGTRRR